MLHQRLELGLLVLGADGHDGGAPRVAISLGVVEGHLLEDGEVLGAAVLVHVPLVDLVVWGNNGCRK